MKTKSVFAILAIATASPLAWAGAANARQQTASKQSSSSPAMHQKAAPSAQAKQGALAVNSGTKISARLLTTLDAKKAKPGQRVVAKVTRDVKENGHTVIRKNSRLIGHIVSAKASGKGSAGSQVEVAFDRLVQGKSSTALSAVVTSILSVPRPLSPQPMNMPGPMEPMGAPMQSSGAPMGGGRMGGGGGLLGGAGGAVAGVGSTVGGTLNSGVNAAGSAANAGMNAGGNVAGNTMAGAHGILVSNSVTGSGSGSSSTAVSHPQPGSPAKGNSNPGLMNSVSSALSGNASASGSAAGRHFAGSGNASNQAGATSVFSQRKGNVQLQSGTQLQLQVVGSEQQPQRHPAPRSSSRPAHR